MSKLPKTNGEQTTMNGLIPKDYGTNDECIVIMLGDKNFEVLKGYKAEVLMHKSVLPDKLSFQRAYLTITITGLSNKGAENIFNSLVQLPPEELTEFVKKKFGELEDKR